jgi:hypothetical protein
LFGAVVSAERALLVLSKVKAMDEVMRIPIKRLLLKVIFFSS